MLGTVENHGKKWQETLHTCLKIACKNHDKITAVYIAANLLKFMVSNSRKIYILGKIHTTMTSWSHIPPVTKHTDFGSRGKRKVNFSWKRKIAAWQKTRHFGKIMAFMAFDENHGFRDYRDYLLSLIIVCGCQWHGLWLLFVVVVNIAAILVCGHHCTIVVHTIQHWTVLIIFPLILQISVFQPGFYGRHPRVPPNRIKKRELNNICRNRCIFYM